MRWVGIHRGIRRLIGVGVLVATAAVWVLVLGPSMLGGPATYLKISGISMEPVYYAGDLVVTRERAAYGIGDIVAFRGGEGIVIHRIIGGDAQFGFVLQGDNNNFIDPWEPTPDEILGEAWLHLPGKGDLASTLREPLNLGFAAGGLTMISLLGQGKRRRKGTRPAKTRAAHATHSADRSPTTALLAACTALTLVGVLAALGAATAFRQPTTTTLPADGAGYTHEASFDWVVHTAPSVVYPDRTVTPADAPEAQPVNTDSPFADDATAAGPPAPVVYTKLAERLDLDVRYALTSAAALDVTGTYAVLLDLRAAGGPAVTTELVPETRFDGRAVEEQVTIDFADVAGRIETIEEETGASASSYELTVRPVVRVDGTVAGEPIDEEYAPAFAIQYTGERIEPDMELTRSATEGRGEDVVVPNTVGLLGANLGVTALRWVSGGLLVLCALLTAALGLVVSGRLGGDPVSRLRARHGAINVTDVGASEATRHVVVRDVADVARLAERSGAPLLHHHGTDGHRFLVEVGSVRYECLLPDEEG